ncbi:MAG: hypothetical protein GF399_06600 [Candidatus Coatesbacteria bacterium]|nr:hypothetical protein [Candidatus Coatesbacteria bacterium]
MRPLFRVATTCLLLACLSPAVGGEIYYRTLAQTNTRPLGMAGAFTAVPCEFEAALYNPATFVHGQGFGGALDLGLTGYWLFRGFDEEARLEDVELGGSPDSDYLSLALSTLVGFKSLSYTAGGFSAFINLWEAALHPPASYADPHFFHVRGLWANRSNTLGVNYRFREAGVALGASASYYTRELPVEDGIEPGGEELERRSGYGFTFGALWEFQPSFFAGATFVELPEGLGEARAGLEGLGDETINLGLSWRLRPDAIVALDVRNLVNAGSAAFRELRLGVDQRLLNHVTFRGGYAYTAEEEHLWSLGLGIGDGRLGAAGSIPTNLVQSNYVLNYAFVKNQTTLDAYHLMSFIVTF